MLKTESWHVVRTLRVLECLALRPHTEVELARQLEVHPRTVRRLARRLIAEGYAIESSPRVYVATLRIVALAGHIVERTDLVRTAFPYVVSLRNRTGEAAHLSVPSDNEVIHLVQETGKSVVTVKPRLGEQVPYHCTAVGKALLAYLSAQYEHISDNSLQRFTEHTIVNRADLLRELATIRERGYATDDREYSLELRCVAAPVFSASGGVVAAIGISAPSSRLLVKHFSGMGKIVAQTALELSGALGFAFTASERDVPSRAMAQIPWAGGRA